MEGHRERLRKRFLSAGIKGFDDREALELMLTFALPRVDTRSVSVALMEKFGSLDNIFRQPPATLMTVQGVGESAAVLLCLTHQMQVLAAAPSRKTVITGPESVSAYLRKRLGTQRKERFTALLLNSANELIAEVDLEFGTVNRTQVYPRNLVEKVITHNASGVILVHNHPGGRLEASREDIALTGKLAKLGTEMDFRVLDHFIVTEDAVLSLRSSGLIES